MSIHKYQFKYTSPRHYYTYANIGSIINAKNLKKIDPIFFKLEFKNLLHYLAYPITNVPLQGMEWYDKQQVTTHFRLYVLLRIWRHRTSPLPNVYYSGACPEVILAYRP